MKKITFILLSFIVSISIGIAQNAKTDPAFKQKLKEILSGTVPFIQPSELNQLQKNNTNLYILDTRAQKEYQVSHIKNSSFVDYDNFKVSQVSHIPKNATIVVYCSVGWRSEKIGEKLKKAGYTNIKNLYGGVFEWVNQGFKVYDNTGKETKQVHTYSKDWAKYVK